MPRERKKKTVRLLTHRSVAAMFDIDTSTVRKWVVAGMFPRPHSIIGRTWFYDAAVIDHYLKTGGWPDGVHFNGISRRQRGQDSETQGWQASRETVVHAPVRGTADPAADFRSPGAMHRPKSGGE
jgi:predicted DNA-binding transcriptional regulator AlpA